MQKARTDDGIDIAYRIDGPESARPLILSNSLGTNFNMWEANATALAADRRLIRYDQRGHGGSSAPPGPYTMERLGRDVIALMDALAIDTADFCGISMGGMTGIWLAANAGERFGKLVLSNTAAYSADKSPWDSRIEAINKGGMAAIRDMIIPRWFSPEFHAANPDQVDRILQMVLAADPTGYIGCCSAIRDMDLRPELAKIAVPILVIIGSRDISTPPQAGSAIASGIAGAELAELDASHLSNIERPAEHIRTVLDFLNA